MKKLRCSSCGAELNVEENNEYAVCSHCGTRYKLNEDLNLNIKLDDNMKSVLNNGLETVKHPPKFMVVAIIIFFIIILTITITSFIKINNDRENIKDNIKEEQHQGLDQFVEENKKYQFNFQFIHDNGTKSDFFLEGILDKIIQSNKTHERLIILVFNGTEKTTEKEILDVKHSLKGDYEVSFNYDDGYINKIIVDKID